MNTKKYKYIIGIDEVGRGPIAGPISVCTFCVSQKNLDQVKKELRGITDSKKLSESKREEYLEKIKSLKNRNLCTFAISHVSAKVIDEKGIVYAINLALKRSLKKLGFDPKNSFTYLDGGLHAPTVYEQETVIKGDQKIWQISTASVIAKVLRDQKMIRYAKKYPEYGFEEHKGYGTQKHRQAIKKEGIITLHRNTWIKP